MIIDPGVDRYGQHPAFTSTVRYLWQDHHLDGIHDNMTTIYLPPNDRTKNKRVMYNLVELQRFK